MFEYVKIEVPCVRKVSLEEHIHMHINIYVLYKHHIFVAIRVLNFISLKWSTTFLLVTHLFSTHNFLVMYKQLNLLYLNIDEVTSVSKLETDKLAYLHSEFI